MNLNNALKKFLHYAHKHGIRRMYEVLPGWVEENYPKLYKKEPLFAELAKIPNKNVRSFREMPLKEKARIRQKRTNVYSSIYYKARGKIDCPTCKTQLPQHYDQKVPPCLDGLLKDMTFCSVRCTKLDPAHSARVKRTNLRKYGVTCTLNTRHSIRKKKKTWRQNYGVENPSHCPLIIQKIQTARYGRKTITLKGKTFEYQGYEATFLKYLVIDRDIEASRISTKAKCIGLFPYKLHGEKKLYLPDIRLTKRNGEYKYYEVKSVYTLRANPTNKSKVLAKAKGMWDAGLDYELILCSRTAILARYKDMKSLRKAVHS